MEEWKPVVGYEGIYIVSDHGRVVRTAGWSDGRKIKVCGERKLDYSSKGYPRVTLFRDKSRRKFFVHRLVYEAFNGPMPIGLEINHKNGRPADSRLENLEAITHSANWRHALTFLGKVENMPRGSKHWQHKLTEESVKAMRKLRSAGISNQDIAKWFEVSEATASEVCRGKMWTHVPPS